MRLRFVIPAATTLAALLAPAAAADERPIRIIELDQLVKQEAPGPDGPNATIATAIRAGASQMQVVVMRSTPLHHHDHDHVVYIVRGDGTARLEGPAQDIETRPIKAGDLLDVPRGRKHAFERRSDQDLVLLVLVAAPPEAGDDTTFHE